MKKWEDLRFIIGSFFGIVGVILLITSQLISTPAVDPNEPNLNLLSGIMMTLFSIVMIGLSVSDRRE